MTAASTTPSPPPGLSPGGRFAQWDPQPIRHVAIDVDGTLVGAHDTVRPDAVAALAAAARSGMSIGYATGRMHGALVDIDEQVRLGGPHVVHNGALVRHREQTVASWPLTPDEVEVVLAIAAEHRTYVELYLEDGFLVDQHDPRAEPHWDLLGQPPRGDASTLDGRAVTKATFIAFEGPAANAIVDALEEAGLAAGPAGSLLTPEMTYINATRRGVDKGAALDTAARVVGTDLSGVLALGDGHNDIPMLSLAGTAVAMGQAHPDVRAAAHLVTTHVDEGGLALALGALLDLPGDDRAA